MPKQIKNPYIAKFIDDPFNGDWKVLYRFLIASQINFSQICSCNGDHGKFNAQRIARLLNAEHEK